MRNRLPKLNDKLICGLLQGERGRWTDISGGPNVLSESSCNSGCRSSGPVTLASSCGLHSPSLLVAWQFYWVQTDVKNGGEPRWQRWEEQRHWGCWWNMLAFIMSTLLLFLPCNDALCKHADAARFSACGSVFETRALCARTTIGRQRVSSWRKLHISYQIWMFSFDRIAPPLHPRHASRPLLVESVAMAAAASAQAGCIHPSPWTMVVLLKLPISLSDRLERRRRLCEYILINRNGRALGGEIEVRLRENWQNLMLGEEA